MIVELKFNSSNVFVDMVFSSPIYVEVSPTRIITEVGGTSIELLISETVGSDTAVLNYPILVNKNVKFLFIDGIKLPAGLADRMSYISDTITGTLTFTSTLNSSQYIEVYV